MKPNTILLSVDFEDWHQLVGRRLGLERWEEPGPALRRQTDQLLALFEQLGVRATFFVLGMAARSHPGLVERIAAAGHEIGCHGDAHRLVSSQTRDEFAADLRAGRSTIEQLTGTRPVGYRAPAFSITPETPWAYEVLLDEGFLYDASEHDSPLLRDQTAAHPPGPRPLDCQSGRLWELPVAVWRRPLAAFALTSTFTSGVNVPVGGASYWSLMPTRFVLNGLAAVGPGAGIYLHPYELDPEPLRLRLSRETKPAQRAHGLVRTAQRNLARRRAPAVLRAIAGNHELVPYGDAYAELSGGVASA